MNAEYPFIVIEPRSIRTGVVAPDRVLSMGENWHLNYVQTNDLYEIKCLDPLNVSKQTTNI